MQNVLIVGCGVVGRNLANEISVLNPQLVDKYKPELPRPGKPRTYDFAFVCVDTPKTSDSLCDTSEIVNAISENDASIYIIKSTVLPGTTARLAEETGKTIIFCPEFYGSTQHCNNYNFDFSVLGGNRGACLKTIQLLQNVYDARHSFRVTDAKTAELMKYMVNSYLATKVTFCLQFNEIAEQLDIDYEELRELFILDPRINPSHTFIYKDKPYWDSHCLNKDIPAIAEYVNADLLRYIISFNERLKSKC